jgi:hypothetical protein
VTADALARSAQLHYRLPRPKYTPAPALSRTAMLLLQVTGGRGAAADLVMMRQLANTMKAIHDAHVARGELKQALILEGVVRDELRQFMETLPQAAGPVGIGAAAAGADAPVAARPAVDRAAEVESDAARLAVTAAVGPELAQVWQADPAWAALEMRIVDLADDGLDPVATVRLAYGQRDFDDAESAVQVMTWRIDGLVRDHRAPGASGTNDPEVTAALEALKAMTHGTADQAVRSPLPNPLEPRRPTPTTSQTTPTATDAEIGD